MHAKQKVGIFFCNIFEKSVTTAFVFYCDPRYLNILQGSNHVLCYLLLLVLILLSAAWGSAMFSFNGVVVFQGIGSSFFNMDSLHARMNSHYKAWGYKKKKQKKIKAYRKSL